MERGGADEWTGVPSGTVNGSRSALVFAVTTSPPGARRVPLGVDLVEQLADAAGRACVRYVKATMVPRAAQKEATKK